MYYIIPKTLPHKPMNNRTTNLLQLSHRTMITIPQICENSTTYLWLNTRNQLIHNKFYILISFILFIYLKNKRIRRSSPLLFFYLKNSFAYRYVNTSFFGASTYVRTKYGIGISQKSGAARILSKRKEDIESSYSL